MNRPKGYHNIGSDRGIGPLRWMTKHTSVRVKEAIEAEGNALQNAVPHGLAKRCKDMHTAAEAERGLSPASSETAAGRKIIHSSSLGFGIAATIKRQQAKRQRREPDA